MKNVSSKPPSSSEHARAGRASRRRSRTPSARPRPRDASGRDAGRACTRAAAARGRASSARGSRASPSQSSCVGSAAKRRSSASSAAASSSRQSRVERDVVVQEEHVLGAVGRARRGCRGSRARGSARDDRAPARVRDRARCRRSSSRRRRSPPPARSVCASRLARQSRQQAARPGSFRSRRRRQPASSSVERGARAARETRAGRARADVLASGRRISCELPRHRRASARDRGRELAGPKPSTMTRPPERRTSSSGPPHGVDDAARPQASASATAMPKPSCSDGETKQRALAQHGSDIRDDADASTPAGRPPRAARRRAAGAPRALAREPRERVEQQRDVLARVVGAADEDEARAGEPREPPARRAGAKRVDVDGDRQDADAPRFGRRRPPASPGSPGWSRTARQRR